MKPRAITGFGIVSPLGIGRSEFEATLAKGGECELRDSSAPVAIQSFDSSKYLDADIAEVRGFDPNKYLGEKGLRTLDRLTKLLLVAARLGLHDAGLKKDGMFVQGTPERVGLVCSNAYGSLEAITELDRVAVLEDARYINPAKFPNTVSNSAAGYVSIWEDLRAINVTVSDGNCGGLDALACADIFFDTNRAEALLVGGAEAMSEALYLAFLKLGAVARRSADGRGVRGTRIGEAAAFLVVEPAEKAAARNAHVVAEAIGYGTSFVAPPSERALIHPSPQAMERAIATALEDARVSVSDIDVVVSGVSGLKMFDDAELGAIDRTMGPNVPVFAPKQWLGETLGAGGAVAMAAAVSWMNHSASGHPVVRGSLRGQPRTVLVTCIGYYGNASAVVMRRAKG